MATEKRLIDAKALERQIKEAFKDSNPVLMGQMLRWVRKQTIVDAVEVVHGHWVSDKADILFHCSVCETQISTDWDYDDLCWNYCPNCGAKMDGERKDNARKAD